MRPYWLTAKYAGKCRECGDDVSEGDRIVYSAEEKRIYCGPCGEEVAGPDKHESNPITEQTFDTR